MTREAHVLWLDYQNETDPLARQMAYIAYLRAVSSEESVASENGPARMPAEWGPLAA